MKAVRTISCFLLSLSLMSLMFSCAFMVPTVPVTEAGPEQIMGKGSLAATRLAAFLRESNPSISSARASEMANLYVEEATYEGVNHDIAFAQMCVETGFLRFGNLVTPDMNNFCGLGSIGPGTPGERFPSARLGVRAHIQHLQAYATTAPLKKQLVDPRYRYVRRGSAPTIAGLAGTWARDPEYGNKIRRVLEKMYR